MPAPCPTIIGLKVINNEIYTLDMVPHILRIDQICLLLDDRFFDRVYAIDTHKRRKKSIERNLKFGENPQRSCSWQPARVMVDEKKSHNSS